MTFPKFEKQGTGRELSPISISIVSVLSRVSISVDEELAAKLKSELEFEISKEDESGYPLSVKEFLDTSPFKVYPTSCSWGNGLKSANISPLQRSDY